MSRDYIIPYCVKSVKVAVAVYVSDSGTGTALAGTVMSNSNVEVAPETAALLLFTISKPVVVGSFQHLVALVVPFCDPSGSLQLADESFKKDCAVSDGVLEVTVYANWAAVLAV